jgi:hypothetical protein
MLSLLRSLVSIFLSASLALAAEPTLGVSLSSAQKHAFVAAVLDTEQMHMEDQLPRRLASSHVFKPYFSMYELAGTAYALVTESPHDMSRWRTLAKIAAYADGEYAAPYESARRQELSQNPRLFSLCPQFEDLANKARHGERI